MLETILKRTKLALLSPLLALSCATPDAPLLDYDNPSSYTDTTNLENDASSLNNDYFTIDGTNLESFIKDSYSPETNDIFVPEDLVNDTSLDNYIPEINKDGTPLEDYASLELDSFETVQSDNYTPSETSSDILVPEDLNDTFPDNYVTEGLIPDGTNDVSPEEYVSLDGAGNSDILINDNLEETCKEETFYLDNDKDDYGQADKTILACVAPEGYAKLSGDCDDTNPLVHVTINCNYDSKDCGLVKLCLTECPPLPEEKCDGIDNNCNYKIDEGCVCVNNDIKICGENNDGECKYGKQTCKDNIWGDCLGVVIPTKEECDGKDNNCNNLTDEDLTLEQVCGVNNEGECKLGAKKKYCINGKYTDWQDCTAILPKLEECNGKDDDCNGKTDENLIQPCSSICGTGLEYCVNGEWKNCTAPLPSAETCDSLDNDCNGETDENTTLEQGCGISNLGACTFGKVFQYCINGKYTDWQDCTATFPQLESCNGKDDNCNGKTDENVSSLEQVCGENNTGECTLGKEKKYCINGNYTDWKDCTAILPTLESCNGKDDDCNGQTDENTTITLPCGITQTGACTLGEEFKYCINGKHTEGQDCTAKFPTKEECNGKDDDCNGQTDEFQTIYLPCGVTNTGACTLGEEAKYCINGKHTEGQDCTAKLPTPEKCDNIDNDCNNQTDENLTQTCTSKCGAGLEYCVNGAWKNCNAPLPKLEECNDKDDDCDGLTDNNICCNLSGSWNFDEGTGTQINDLSGKNYNGTITGATWVDGILGKALNFDGNDYVAMSYHFNDLSNQGSVCLWFKLTDNFQAGNPDAELIFSVLDNNLVSSSQYRFNNNLNDTGTNGLTLNVTTPSYETSPPKLGNAYWKFTGSGTNTPYLAHDERLDLGKAEFGIAYWLKTPSGAYGAVWSKATTTSGCQINVNANGSTSFTAGEYGTGSILTLSKPFADAQWHHTVWTRNAQNKLMIYIDSVLEANPSTTTYDYSYAGPARIGNQNVTGYYALPAGCFMDDLRIIKGRSFTQDEVAKMYNGGYGNETNFTTAHNLRMQLNSSDGKLTIMNAESPSCGEIINSMTNSWVKDQWYQACFVLNNNNTISLYVNGILENTSPNKCGLHDKASVSYLGTNFKGIIDELKVYNCALTPDQIAAEYKKISGK